MAAATDTYLDLSRKGAVDGGTEPEPGLTRNDLPLPAARWAFAPKHLSGASEPIECAQGYLLIAATELHPGLTKAGDMLKAFVVTYFTHDADDYRHWLGQTRQRLRGQVSYVAPELEGCLPRWLMP